MKNFALSLVSISIVISFSCSSIKNSGKGYDEVYDDPIELRKLQLAAQKKAQEEMEQKEKEWYARKEKEMSLDPKYNDREFSYEDYYDYEYASRLKRFHQFNPGLSYYDDWYTNQWFYNPCSCAWNQSIYSPFWYNGMNCWNMGWNTPMFIGNYGPGAGWNYGISLGWGWGNTGFWNNPWYWNYPYYGWGWNYPYGGWAWNNPYWNYAYYNPYDVNTYHYGPRGFSGGSNSTIRSYAGMTIGEAEKNLESGRLGRPTGEKDITSGKFQTFQEHFTLTDHPGIKENPRPFNSNSISGFDPNPLKNQAISSTDPYHIMDNPIPRNGLISKIYAEQYSADNVSWNSTPIKGINSSFNISENQNVNVMNPSGSGRPGIQSLPVKIKNISGSEENLPFKSESIKPERNSGLFRNLSPSDIKISTPRHSGGGINIRPR
ncbi:MAG: hypothetical protein N3F09_10530 [Bacteroidia bacterium]|nr:hypothetical protein [Bacteroidia bacterium]